MSKRVLKIGRLVVVTVGLFATHQAAALECSDEFQVQQSFANGAAWEMCWEEQNREGMVLRDIHYTSPEGVRRRVLYQANVAQIHVPYDDDGARYHDVSDFGLGGTRLNDLAPEDCPTGTLVKNGSKDVFCKTLLDATALATASEVRYGELLSLFSVSHVGAYNYIPDWRFFDDGTIEPAMGATGRLQRYASSEAFGWPVRTGTSPVGVSHIHNYYWRLDFDLDGGDDDRFEELEFVDATGGTRALQSTQFANESARSLNAATQRFWRVYDGGTQSSSGRPISYDIVPLETGHSDIGPSFEPWTFNDIYATAYRACERFVSHNPADSAGGCETNGDVSSFVNGESLDNSDLVLWFGLTFHHTPRDEDEAYMNAHWNRFRLTPRDWLDVGSRNASPVIQAIADRLETTGEVVSFAASATDVDDAELIFTAVGLPSGVSISSNGDVAGTLTGPGTYAVTVTASDSLGASSSTRFSWNVQPNSACTGCLNFVGTATEGYGGQDVAGNVQVQDVGATIFLQDNTWRRTENSYTITANTMLAFEFASSQQGEVHGIGFDSDFSISQNQVFQLYGTQTWGEQDFRNYEPAEFVSYAIPVGTYFTGTDMRMIFVNDFDAGTGNISRFRNVRVYEASDTTHPSIVSGPVSGPVPVPANVALGGSATQVSQLNVGIDLSAAKANDGNTDGEFEAFSLAHTDAASQAWWQIDLGARYDVSRVELFNRTDCCADALQNFHVFVSDVPFDSAALGATQRQPGVLDIAHPGTAATRTVLPVNRSGRFVRVQLAGADYLQLAEVEVWGVPAGQGVLNLAPVVTNPGAQSDSLGSSVNVPLAATDAEADALSFSASNLPHGLVIEGTTGVVSGSPTAAGTYNSVVSVSDGNSVTQVIFEWTVTGVNGLSNVALGGLATQSSMFDLGFDLGLDFSASNAIDGVRGGSFPIHAIAHTRADAQPWWEIDLGARYALSSVVVYNREDCCAERLSDFYVIVSDTPFTSQGLAATLAQPGVANEFTPGRAGRTTEVPLSRTGRYVRVQLSGSDYLQLAEVEVFGLPL